MNSVSVTVGKIEERSHEITASIMRNRNLLVVSIVFPTNKNQTIPRVELSAVTICLIRRSNEDVPTIFQSVLIPQECRQSEKLQSAHLADKMPPWHGPNIFAGLRSVLDTPSPFVSNGRSDRQASTGSCPSQTARRQDVGRWTLFRSWDRRRDASCSGASRTSTKSQNVPSSCPNL